jgi:hypothetical protein
MPRRRSRLLRHRWLRLKRGLKQLNDEWRDIDDARLRLRSKVPT